MLFAGNRDTINLGSYLAIAPIKPLYATRPFKHWEEVGIFDKLLGVARQESKRLPGPSYLTPRARRKNLRAIRQP
jgi:hypothetical protein